MKQPIPTRLPADTGTSRLGRAWAGALACALLVSAALPPLRAAETAAALEYKVKAGYLFNFARYVEWPAAAFPATNSPFVVAVLDAGEASPVVEQVLGVKEINGHPVRVRAVSASSLPKDVHILFVTRASGKTAEEIQAALGGVATLVVGESDQFAEHGGMVGFVREGEAIRLTLNVERATESGLKVSAKLASVAKVVKTKQQR